MQNCPCLGMGKISISLEMVKVNKKKRVLLLTAPYHAGVVEIAGKWIPLYLVYIAGTLREAGYDVTIYDAMTKDVGHAEIEAEVRRVKPHYVGLSSITCTLPDAVECVKRVKAIDPQIVTVMGGIHPTFMPEEVFELAPELDYIIRGEAEKTLPEFFEALEAGRVGDELKEIRGIAYRDVGGKTVRTTDRPLMTSEELDNLPKAFDLLDWSEYPYYMVKDSTMGALDTSRGCTKDCSFCSQRLFWKQSWRPRSPESLMRDIEEQMRHGATVFLLTDDYPTLDPERWETFLDLVIESGHDIYFLMETRAEDIIRDRDILHKYRQAGVIHIYVGTEATDEEKLALYRKEMKPSEAGEAFALLDSHGIITETSMILGTPDETQESVKRTLELAIKNNPDFCHFLAISPWPYADLYGHLEPHVAVHDYRKYNLIDPIVKPLAMTLEEVDRAIIDCYREFYMNKFKQIVNLEDEFKREYILESTRRIMQNSFIVNKLGSLEGSIPDEVKAEMAKIGVEEFGEDGKMKFITEDETKNGCPVSYVKRKMNKIKKVTGLSRAK